MYRLRLAGAVVPIHGSKNAARTAAVQPAPLAAGRFEIRRRDAGVTL